MEVHAIFEKRADVAAKNARGRPQIQGCRPSRRRQSCDSFAQGARLVAKNPEIAIANAENNNKLKPEAITHQGGRRRSATITNGFNPRRALQPVPSSNAVCPSKSPCPTNNVWAKKQIQSVCASPSTKDWRSKWFAGKKEFGQAAHEDRQIRTLLKKKLESASVPKSSFERPPTAVASPFSRAARRGHRRKGAEIDKLRKS